MGVSDPAAARTGATVTGTTPGTPSIPGYEVIGTLGVGGMGTVYRALQRSLSRPVALKVIQGTLAKDPEFAERFLREARAAGAVNHPNVITCYDVGTVGDQLYMALELVTGGDAAALARRHGGQLSETRTIEIGLDCARGLAAIARAGLIHRDIKPSNIFIAEDGTAKLADLGLARSTAGDDRMTVTGRAMGTPAFMSPEQARGDASIDIRSDICALGATLYALATGQMPFDGSSAWVVVAKVMNEAAPDPRSVRPDLSPGFAAVIGRCMAKQRDDRYPTPEHLLVDLEHVLAGRQPQLDQVRPGTAAMRRLNDPVTPVTLRRGIEPASQATVMMAPPKAAWGWMAASAAAAAVVVGSAVWLLTMPKTATQPTTATTSTQTSRPASATGPATAAMTSAGGPSPKPESAKPAGPPAAAIAAANGLRERLHQVSPKAEVTALEDGTLSVRGLDPDLRNLDLLVGQSISRLSLVGCQRISRLTQLRGLPLVDLDVSGNTEIETLDGLQDAPLRTIELSRCTSLADVTALRGKAIARIGLAGCTSLTSLRGLESMQAEQLDLSGCTSLSGDLLPLNGRPLIKLSVAGCTGLTSLLGLQASPLVEVDARGCSGLTGDLDHLRGRPITTLKLGGCRRLTRLTGIETLTALHELDLSGCDRLDAPPSPTGTRAKRVSLLAAISRLPIRTLDLSHNEWLDSLSPLTGMQIHKLALTGCTEITDVGPLRGMPLQDLDLVDCSGITSLEPLAGCPLRSIAVTGAKRVANEAGLKPLLGIKGLSILK